MSLEVSLVVSQVSVGHHNLWMYGLGTCLVFYENPLHLNNTCIVHLGSNF